MTLEVYIIFPNGGTTLLYTYIYVYKHNHILVHTYLPPALLLHWVVLPAATPSAPLFLLVYSIWFFLWDELISKLCYFLNETKKRILYTRLFAKNKQESIITPNTANEVNEQFTPSTYKQIENSHSEEHYSIWMVPHTIYTTEYIYKRKDFCVLIIAVSVLHHHWNLTYFWNIFQLISNTHQACRKKSLRASKSLVSLNNNDEYIRSSAILLFAKLNNIWIIFY